MFQALSPGLRRLIYLVAFVIFFAYLGTVTANHSGKIALLLIVAAMALFSLCVPRARWLVIVSPAVAAFLLLNRFDNGFALVVGDVTLKFNYWYAAVILAGLFLSAAVNRRVRLQPVAAPNPFLAWYGFFLGIFAVTGVLSIAVNAAFDESLRHAPMTELFALGLVVVPALFPLAISASGISREDTLRCMDVLVVLAAATGLIMVAFGIFPYVFAKALGWSKELGGGGGLARAPMPLGHPNTASGVLLLLLPIAVIRGIESRSFVRTLVYLGASFLMMGGILFSLSRSTLAIAMPILMACMLYFLRARKKWTILVLAVWLVAGAAGVVFLATRYDFSRFWSQSYYENASVSRRAQTMITAVHVFRDYPVLGASPGSVYRRDDLDPDWVPDQVDAMGEILFYKEDVTARHAHNVYLQALAEYGLLGGLAFFLMMLYLAKSLWRAYLATRNSATGGHGNITAYGLSLMSFLGLGLMAAFFLYSLRVGVVFWTLFGLALHYCGLVLNERAMEPDHGSR